MIVWGMRDVPDKLTTVRSSVPLKAVFNSRVWPGLTTYLDGEKKSFILDREGVQYHFPVIDPYRWIGPRQTMRDAFDLLVFLTNLDANDPDLIEEFLALEGRAIPEAPPENTAEKVVNPQRFQLARKAIPLQKLVEIFNVPTERLNDRFVAFFVVQHGRSHRYIVDLESQTFRPDGVEARLDGFDAYLVLTNQVSTNPDRYQNEFVEFVLKHCDQTVAGQLAA
jgi:hypothetical protein